ncbi:MAG: integrase [Clostridia bacterium]|nr:integrase [Clostridia bacterium]
MERPTDHDEHGNNTSSVPPSLAGEHIIELGDHVDFSNFQVVRGEFYADIRSPYITINKYKVYVNSACLRLFPDAEYVFILVNKESKLIVLRPCEPFARDAYRWRKESKGKIVPRQGVCKLLFALVMNLMHWNPDIRYKLLGSIAHANNEYVLVFDLTTPKFFPTIQGEGQESKVSKTGVYPEDWSGQFGLPYYEHQRYMQINVLDGFTVIAQSPSTRNTESTNTAQGGFDYERTESRTDPDDRHEEEQDSGKQANACGDRNAQQYPAIGRSAGNVYSGEGDESA